MQNVCICGIIFVPLHSILLIHTDMKKFSIAVLFLSLAFGVCEAKTVAEEEQELSHEDSLLYNVLRAIGDSTYSCIDYKDSFYELLDTMQAHVESHPDEDIRIGAKSLALDLVGICLYGDFLSPEEQRFFIDSLVLRFSDVMSTWYSPYNASEKELDWRIPLLSQCVVFHDNDQDDAKFIYFDMYLTPEHKEVMIVTLPQDAEQLASIMFMDDDTDFDKAKVFNISDAEKVLEKTAEDGLSIFFGKDFIDAMLSNSGMFISYVGEEDGETLEDRFHSAHLLLTKFHEQYAHIKPLIHK